MYAEVLLPLVARGLIARRPAVLRLEESFDADGRAVATFDRLRRTYGPGPLLVSVADRTLAVVLDPVDVHRVLAETPVPFSPANRESRAALARFQPHGTLVSTPDERAFPRPFNGQVLDEVEPMHRFAHRFTEVIDEEADRLLAELTHDRVLTWDAFADTWWYAVRRIVLGDSARGDHALTDMLTALRSDANWGHAHPRRGDLRSRFLRQLAGHLERAERGSLVHLAASTPTQPGTDRLQQVPQWLFAFGPAGMATIRALALLAAHLPYQGWARVEIPGHRAFPRELPLLRAAVLESLRLWPTTPTILRDTTEDTHWDGGILDAGSGVLIFTPFFHREPTQPWADRFAPELWLQDARHDWPLVPFSAGPAVCPGRNVVHLTASTMLARLIAAHEVQLDPPDRLTAGAALPGTLSPFHLRFRLTPSA